MRVLSFLLFVFLLCQSVAAETLRLGPESANRLPQIFKKLKSGDKVILDRGRYNLKRSLVLDGLSNVTIEGRGRTDLVLSDLDDDVITIRDCNRIQIKGIRARHEEPAEKYQCEGAVIAVRSSNKVLVRESRLNGCGAAGVYAQNSKNVIVYKNKIFNNSFAGVWISRSVVLIRENSIFDNAAAVVNDGDSSITMVENRVEDNEGSYFGESGFLKEVLGER